MNEFDRSTPESIEAPVSKELENNEQVEIDPKNILFDREKSEKVFGTQANVIAEVTAGQENFYILNLDDQTDYLKGVVVFTVKNNDPYVSGQVRGNFKIKPKKYDGDYMLVNDDFFASNGSVGYRPISKGESVLVGRNYDAELFRHLPTTSGDQFVLHASKKEGEDSLMIENLTPTNPTVIKYVSENR